MYKSINEILLVKDIKQLSIFYKDSTLEKDTYKKDRLKHQNIWDKENKVEENIYYWKKTPVFFPGKDVNPRKPIVVELFCGCGGTSYGFQMAGYDIIMGIDIHTPSILSFKKNHKNAAAILGDIKIIDPEMVLNYLGNRRLDVLIAGVPCQGFSLNNRKRHQEDERNFLYKEFIRFLKKLKPKVVVLENVTGMQSTNNGEFVKNIEKDIEKYGDMKVKSSVLYAPDYGVPQKRSRLVFVGVNGNDAFEFNKIKKTHGTKTKPYVTIYDAIKDLPKLNSGEKKTSYESQPFTKYQEIMRKGSNCILFNHQAPNHPPQTINKIKSTLPGKPMYPKFKQRIRLSWDSQSPTQVSGGIRPQFQFGHPSDARGLTVRERCRIQSFPDNFIIEGGIVQGRVQTGNAVPPLLAKALALEIRRYLK